MTGKKRIEGTTVALDNLLYQLSVIVCAILGYIHDFLYFLCEKSDIANRRNGSMIS